MIPTSRAEGTEIRGRSAAAVIAYVEVDSGGESALRAVRALIAMTRTTNRRE